MEIQVLANDMEIQVLANDMDPDPTRHGNNNIEIGSG